MAQSKRHSWFEACANVAIGYGVAMATQLAVFPFFGIHIPLTADFAIGAIFTVVSLARSYLLRRLFNKWQR